MRNTDKSPIREFPSTRWTLIGRSARFPADPGSQALDELLKLYLPAMKAHLVWIKKLEPDRADDLIQGFISDKVLTGDLLARADRKRGKFRTFLLTSLERYMISQFRKENAARRSPGKGGFQDLDAVAEWIEDPGATPCLEVFDIVWARQIIEETLHRTRAELESSGRLAYWAIFEARVVGPTLHGEPCVEYATLVERLGFASPMQAANALVTAKRVFQRTFRSVIREYVEEEGQVDEEIDDLNAILSNIRA